MKSIIAIAIVILVANSFLICQPGFNIIIDEIYDMNGINDMIVVNDTIIGYGVGFDKPINGNQGLILIKIDSFGNLLNSAIILDTLGDRLAINKAWGKIISTPDGGFAMTAATVFRNSAFLIKTNKDFEIEFIHEYEDSINLSNFFYKIISVPNGYILYGSFQKPDFVVNSFVRKVDFQGNIIWNESYGNPNLRSLTADAKVFNDSLIVIVSFEHTTIDNFGPQKNVIRKININNGGVISEWSSAPDPDMGLLSKICILDDKSLLAHGVTIIYNVGTTEIVQSTIVKVDEDFNVEYIKKYGRTGTLAAQRWFWDFEPTIDGHFIASGESHIAVNGAEIPSGWLMKFSANGDSIWSRYDFPDFPVDSLGDTFFGGVGVLSSGSIVAGGTATLWNEQAIWLVKVTNDGCMEVINCGLVPAFEAQTPPSVISVYPNPAADRVQITRSGETTTSGEWVLYNAMGYPVKRVVFTPGQAQAEVDVSGLVSGLYFWGASSNGTPVASGKLLIQR